MKSDASSLLSMIMRASWSTSELIVKRLTRQRDAACKPNSLTMVRPETNFKFKDLDAQLERDFPYRVKPPNPEHQHFVFTNSRVYY